VSADEVVVDASLALKWIEQEPYSAEASALLEKLAATPLPTAGARAVRL